MKKIKEYRVYLIVFLLIAVDQIVKIVVTKYLNNDSITIIKGILKFTYCENRGAAFSLGNGHSVILIIMNLLLICGLIYYFERNRNKFNFINKIFFTMVIAGGISNLIDRFIRGYVVDFINVNEIFNFAIFNVADIFIVIGVIGFGLSIIFNNSNSGKVNNDKN